MKTQKPIDVRVRVKGIVPILTNRYNGEQLPEPKPKKKTESWINEQRFNKWCKAAYFSEAGMFYIPPEMLEGALVASAKSFRAGIDFKMAVMVVEQEIPILVNRGNGKYEPLKGSLRDFYVPEFIDLRGTPNARKQMVEQCRPIFRDWALEFTIRYDSMIVEERDLKEACEGMIIGSFRPRFGRVSVESFKNIK